jgi:hypothetical protein
MMWAFVNVNALPEGRCSGSVGRRLGDMPWTASGAGHRWYARMQSRPAFKMVVSEGWRGFVPAFAGCLSLRDGK